MSSKATTFRLSDEVSAELEIMRENLGYSTLNQTVEYIILNYRKTAKVLLKTKQELNQAKHDASTQKDRVTRFVQAFKGLMEP